MITLAEFNQIQNRVTYDEVKANVGGSGLGANAPVRLQNSPPERLVGRGLFRVPAASRLLPGLLVDVTGDRHPPPGDAISTNADEGLAARLRTGRLRVR